MEMTLKNVCILRLYCCHFEKEHHVMRDGSNLLSVSLWHLYNQFRDERDRPPTINFHTTACHASIFDNVAHCKGNPSKVTTCCAKLASHVGLSVSSKT